MYYNRANSLLSKVICMLLFILFISNSMIGRPYVKGMEPTDQSTADTNSFRLIVKSSASAAYQTEVMFTDKKLKKELDDRRLGAAFSDSLLLDTTLTYADKGLSQSFGVTLNGEVVDLTARSMMELSAHVQEVLRAQVQDLRAKHYGELLPWEEASLILPKYSKFTIVDVESGLSFEGQRRAGSHHADVQPLTKEDSATLKSIYGGAWSWDRRAVLVKLNGRTLAGSMHGMPHGGDGIPGNDFNGHFCIHFLGSVTHGSRSVDPAHQVMVHRAAGLLIPYVSKLSPWALIDVWISAANQGDLQLLQVTTGQEQAVHVRSMRRLSKFPELDVNQLLQLETAVSVTATPERASAVVNRRVLFRLERASLDARWYIRSAVMQ
ncbi:hypothetical protein GCM10008018_00940 [Paenibacillus marchantiophytorum]|uniref:Uncharacterized protein n=1 Tax=Paenibacillus marchantiophytorum TaxID=1619310 RepID=A0ABQ2BMK0_9BACL|nr:hypothetical protein [Paenibacillus marchantiophytorum]GGI43214.1 hypothetical protein GCM10008018_00940 [Paenibacillus marchantiophytorum]